MIQYLLNVLAGIDRACNAVLGGDPRETISSRAQKAQAAGKRWACVLCRFLDIFQRDHCAKYVDPLVGDEGVLKDDQ